MINKNIKKCIVSLTNEKSISLLATLLISNSSLRGFSTAGIGDAGREGDSASKPAQPSPGSTQKTEEASSAQNPCVRTEGSLGNRGHGDYANLSQGHRERVGFYCVLKM